MCQPLLTYFASQLRALAILLLLLSLQTPCWTKTAIQSWTKTETTFYRNEMATNLNCQPCPILADANLPTSLSFSPNPGTAGAATVLHIYGYGFTGSLGSYWFMTCFDGTGATYAIISDTEVTFTGTLLTTPGDYIISYTGVDVTLTGTFTIA